MIFVVSLVIFIVAIISSWLIPGSPQKAKRLAMSWFLFCGLSLLVIAAMRTAYGYDLINYRYMFNEINSLSQALNYPLEKGYTVLSYFFKSNWNSFGLFMMTVAVISVSLKLYALRKLSPLPLISLFLYFLIYFVINDMEQIRTGLAIGFFMLASVYLFKNKKLLAGGWLVLALSFHVSALLSFVSLFWDKVKKIDLRKSLMLITAAAAIGSINFFQLLNFINTNFINSNYLNEKLAAYETTDKSIFLTVFFRLAIYFSFLLIACKQKDQRHRLLLFMYLMSICSLLLFRNIVMLGIRGSSYFKVFEVIIIPETILAISQKWQQSSSKQRFIYFAVIGFAMFYGLYNFYRLMTVPEYFNYNLIG